MCCWKKMTVYITEDIGISSDDYYEENSNKENSNQEKSDKEKSDQKHFNEEHEV